MSDIRTVYNPATGTCDWQLDANGQLAMDNGLDTAALLSLLSDRRAESSDALPSGDDRRGWWGDAFADKTGDLTGSRLWLLARAKDIPATLTQAREYAAEACAWLLEDGIAAKIDVAAERLRPGVLALSVAIVRPDGTQINIRYADLWEST